MEYTIEDYGGYLIEHLAVFMNSVECIDYRDDEELMNLLREHTKVNYDCPCPIEWLPDNLEYITVRNIFEIDKKRKVIVVLDNTHYNYATGNNTQINFIDYAKDVDLIKYIKDFKKVEYWSQQPLDWLPDGITHLAIRNVLFNHPLENLPSTLLYLGIIGGKPIYDEHFFNKSLDYLPIGLKCLDLAHLESEIPLNNLPPTLEYLFIEQRCYSLSLDNLPINIKKVVKIEFNDCAEEILPDEYNVFDY